MQLSIPDWLNILTGHQSLLLGGMAVLICAIALLWINQKKITWAKNAHRALRVVGWLLGAYMTYSAVYLGYYQAVDPLTIILLFLGGAIGMHLQKHIPWAWLAAPIIAGLGITQIWGALLADPAWQVTLGSVAALTLPTFILLTYFERMHQSLGEVLTTYRFAVFVAIVMMLQAVTLWAGISLWGVVQVGINNMITKLLPYLGGTLT